MSLTCSAVLMKVRRRRKRVGSIIYFQNKLAAGVSRDAILNSHTATLLFAFTQLKLVLFILFVKYKSSKMYNSVHVRALCMGFSFRRTTMSTLALLNCAILTAPGTYEMVNCSLEDARELVKRSGDAVQSYIGHSATADVMTTLLKTPICVNRAEFTHAPTQTALVFQVNKRLPEGTILTEAELLEIGFSFKVLTRLK